MSAAEGAVLRDQGMEQAVCAADSRVVALIDEKIQAAIDSGRRFSANDIREGLPTTESQGLVGGRMRRFATKKVDGRHVIKRVGYEPSSLASTHSHPIAVWISTKTHDLVNGGEN